MTSGRADDPTRLSTDTTQIRRRLRRSKKHFDKTGDDTRLKQDIQLYIQADDRYKPVEDWDLEELAHGMPRHRDGHFRGKSPVWITAEVTREAKRRLYNHAMGRLGAQVDVAVQVVMNLMMSEEVDDKGRPIVDARTKLAAAQFVIEHIIGKPKEVLELDATDQARKMFAAAIVLDDGKPQGHLGAVIQGHVVEPTEDPDLGD